MSDIFKCDNCEIYLPIKYEYEKDEYICSLCSAYYDYEDAENYKYKSTAQDRIDNITAMMKSEGLYPKGLHAEDLGLDLGLDD